MDKHNKVKGINSCSKKEWKLGSKHARKDKNIDSLLDDLESRIVFLCLHTPCKENLGAQRTQILTKKSAVLMNCNSDKLQDPSKTEKNTKLTREVS